jgi:alpha-ketoglutarate-dependent taurine dioxygenase
VEVRTIEPGFPAESEADARSVSAEDLAAGLLAHPVLVFRDQSLSPSELVEVAARLGEPERYDNPHPDHRDRPEIAVFSNVEGRAGLAAPPYWHTDGLLREVPPRATLFYSLQAPERGGDTRFLDARELYASLDEDDRRTLADLECVLPTGTRHPLVKEHPVTGVPALYANLASTVGLVGVERRSAAELFAELRRLYEEAEVTYSHRYRPGDLVIWDNDAVAHSATEPPPPEYPRLIWRVDVRPGA